MSDVVQYPGPESWIEPAKIAEPCPIGLTPPRFDSKSKSLKRLAFLLIKLIIIIRVKAESLSQTNEV